jgi:Secretion system C-terminal sorting domain/Reeler domain
LAFTKLHFSFTKPIIFMKIRFIYTFFLCALVACLTMSNETGRAKSQQKGSTGAPGDNDVVSGALRTCSGCHAGSATIQVTVSIDILDGATVVTKFVPNKAYTARVTINTAAGTPSGFGFQMTALRDSAGVGLPYDGFSNPGANMQLTKITSAKRTYAEQKTMSTTNTFEMTWTAPATGKGTVTFYAAGNGVNNNNGSGGDSAAKNSLVLPEASSGIETFNDTKLAVDCIPNPILSDFLVKLPENTPSGMAQLTIFDFSGKVIFQQNQQLNGGAQNLEMASENWQKGIYFLRVTQGGKGLAATKLVKI